MCDLKAQFEAFSKFDNTKSDGTTINLSQIDKWFKQAGVFDHKLTTTDTAIEFGKLKAKVIDSKTFHQFVEGLGKAKGIAADVITQKLASCGAPDTPNTAQAQFEAFSKFGNTKSDGTTINLSQIDKWFKQAGVFDHKLTTTDTAIEFGKLKAKVIDSKTFHQFVEGLGKAKGIAADVITQKLASCGAPGTPNTAQALHVGGVDRLTDTSKYTGAHKERFDSSGKGKGIEGREDLQDDSGYVKNYKGQGTYDKTHE